MADAVKIATNSLNILSQASELVTKFAAVEKILKIADKLSSAFPFVGAVLGLIQGFLPDSKHKEILRSFEKLNNKIDQVRDDIKDLDKMIKWEFTELQYGIVVNQIKEGMRLCFKIGKAKEEAKKKKNQEKLKEVCACPNITLSLNALFDGMAGNGLFQKSILDEFYNKTGGDRPKISALAIRLLQLLCGGLIVLATYETVKRGKEYAKEETKQFDSRLKEICTKVQSVLDRCVENFRGNMLNDINSKLDVGGSNQGLVTEISNLMRDKYDWLENFCLVYNDLDGHDQHYFDGFRVESLHRSGKCGIVFRRKKGKPPMCSNRYDEAHKIVDDVLVDLMKPQRIRGRVPYIVDMPIHAQEGYNNIEAKLKEKGIESTGCAVIARLADLKSDGTFSSKIVRIDKYEATVILLEINPSPNIR